MKKRKFDGRETEGCNFTPPLTRTKVSERNAAFTRQRGRKGATAG
jgi:hypothetical protein